MTLVLPVRYWWCCIYPGISHGLLHVECRVVSSAYHRQESIWFSNAQPHPQNLLPLVNMSDRHWRIYELFQVLGLEDLQSLDKMPKKEKENCSSLLTTNFDISYAKRTWQMVQINMMSSNVFYFDFSWSSENQTMAFSWLRHRKPKYKKNPFNTA